MVAAVETLGERCINDICGRLVTKLEVEEVPVNCDYDIDEDDGFENIILFQKKKLTF